jgi:hypothetical protein
MAHKTTTAKFAAILIAIAAFGTYSSAQGPPPKLGGHADQNDPPVNH